MIKKFEIYAGSVNQAESMGIYEAKNEDEAIILAYDYAVEDFDSYAGLHGTRDIEMIIEEDNVDFGIAEEIFEQERESWLDFYVIEVKD